MIIGTYLFNQLIYLLLDDIIRTIIYFTVLLHSMGILLMHFVIALR